MIRKFERLPTGVADSVIDSDPIGFPSRRKKPTAMHNNVLPGIESTSKMPLPMSESTWKAVASKLDLSPQQTRIVGLILRDLPDKEIADELGLTVPTVRTHIKRIFDRTGAISRLNLVLHIFAMVQKHGM